MHRRPRHVRACMPGIQLPRATYALIRGVLQMRTSGSHVGVHIVRIVKLFRSLLRESALVRDCRSGLPRSQTLGSPQSSGPRLPSARHCRPPNFSLTRHASMNFGYCWRLPGNFAIPLHGRCTAEHPICGRIYAVAQVPVVLNPMSASQAFAEHPVKTITQPPKQLHEIRSHHQGG